ncbi:hypothetical protein PR048_004103 [Dryococelus australis]|uniref:Uncharacterized protein n=1 Tax=Dryococelus australis TaxID=614101 RepID=A0ABQ9I4M2_9NEOP|nr:hypothetical protein PR048_004103 [Dryococelus australis]
MEQRQEWRWGKREIPEKTRRHATSSRHVSHMRKSVDLPRQESNPDCFDMHTLLADFAPSSSTLLIQWQVITPPHYNGTRAYRDRITRAPTFDYFLDKSTAPPHIAEFTPAPPLTCRMITAAGNIYVLYTKNQIPKRHKHPVLLTKANLSAVTPRRHQSVGLGGCKVHPAKCRTGSPHCNAQHQICQGKLKFKEGEKVSYTVGFPANWKTSFTAEACCYSTVVQFSCHILLKGDTVQWLIGRILSPPCSIRANEKEFRHPIALSRQNSLAAIKGLLLSSCPAEIAAIQCPRRRLLPCGSFADKCSHMMIMLKNICYHLVIYTRPGPGSFPSSSLSQGRLHPAAWLRVATVRQPDPWSPQSGSLAQGRHYRAAWQRVATVRQPGRGSPPSGSLAQGRHLPTAWPKVATVRQPGPRSPPSGSLAQGRHRPAAWPKVATVRQPGPGSPPSGSLAQGRHRPAAWPRVATVQQPGQRILPSACVVKIVTCLLRQLPVTVKCQGLVIISSKASLWGEVTEPCCVVPVELLSRAPGCKRSRPHEAVDTSPSVLLLGQPLCLPGDWQWESEPTDMPQPKDILLAALARTMHSQKAQNAYILKKYPQLKTGKRENVYWAEDIRVRICKATRGHIRPYPGDMPILGDGDAEGNTPGQLRDEDKPPPKRVVPDTVPGPSTRPEPTPIVIDNVPSYVAPWKPDAPTYPPGTTTEPKVKVISISAKSSPEEEVPLDHRNPGRRTPSRVLRPNPLPSWKNRPPAYQAQTSALRPNHLPHNPTTQELLPTWTSSLDKSAPSQPTVTQKTLLPKESSCNRHAPSPSPVMQEYQQTQTSSCHIGSAPPRNLATREAAFVENINTTHYPSTSTSPTVEVDMNLPSTASPHELATKTVGVEIFLHHTAPSEKHPALRVGTRACHCVLGCSMMPDAPTYRHGCPYAWPVPGIAMETHNQVEYGVVNLHQDGESSHRISWRYCRTIRVPSIVTSEVQKSGNGIPYYSIDLGTDQDISRPARNGQHGSLLIGDQ